MESCINQTLNKFSVQEIFHNLICIIWTPVNSEHKSWSHRFFVVVILSYLGAVVVVIVRWLDLQLTVQSIPITIKAVSLNPVDGEVYSIQHYAIKFVSDLRQVSSFLRILRFPPPIKLTAMI